MGGEVIKRMMDGSRTDRALVINDRRTVEAGDNHAGLKIQSALSAKKR